MAVDKKKLFSAIHVLMSPLANISIVSLPASCLSVCLSAGLYLCLFSFCLFADVYNLMGRTLPIECIFLIVQVYTHDIVYSSI